MLVNLLISLTLSLYKKLKSMSALFLFYDLFQVWSILSTHEIWYFFLSSKQQQFKTYQGMDLYFMISETWEKVCSKWEWRLESCDRKRWRHSGESAWRRCRREWWRSRWSSRKRRPRRSESNEMEEPFPNMILSSYCRVLI